MSAVMERDDVEPVANETLDRVLTGTFTVVPFLAVAAAAVLAWQQLPALERRDHLRGPLRR